MGFYRRPPESIINLTMQARRDVLMMLSWYEPGDKIAAAINKAYGTELTSQDVLKYRNRAQTQRLVRRIRQTANTDITRIMPIANKTWRLGALMEALKGAKDTKEAVSALRAMREEMEGRQPLVKIEDHQHYTQMVNTKELNAKSNEDLINFLLGKDAGTSLSNKQSQGQPKMEQNRTEEQGT